MSRPTDPPRRAPGSSFAAVAWCLAAVIVVTPLVVGSNRPLLWAINGGLTVLIILLLSALAARRGLPDADWRPVAWGLAGVAAVMAWMVVQVLPLSGAFPGLLAASGPAAVAHTFRTISVDPAATLAALVRFATPALLGFAALIVCLDRDGARRSSRLLDVVILVASLIGAYGLYALHLGASQPSLVTASDYAGFLTGTFVNRNTAATYLAIALVACAARFLETIAAAPHVAPRQRHGRRERSFGGIYIVAAAILATALLSTGSRAGLAAGAAGLAVTIGVGSRGLLRSGGRAWVIILGAGVAVAAVAFLAAGSVLDRIGEEAVTDDTRFAVYSDTLSMIEDRPLLGHGAGTFATLFPLYHGPDVPSERVWLAAHNSYLQAAAELGLPALAVMLLVLAGAFVNVLAHALSPRSAAATVAATGAIVVVAVHAFLDFSLQVEAVAILFAILVGAGTGVSLGARAGSAPAIDARPAVESARGGTPPRGGRAQLRYALVEETPAGEGEAEPAPRRIYVFGDLHGRSDLAADLKAAIARDLAENPCERPLIVGLGDYVDRGPDSRGVVELLVEGLHADAEQVFLRGNHEQLLIDAVAGDEQAYEVWVHSGGLDTLKSYGIDIRDTLRGQDGFEAARKAFARTLPYSHFDFLRATPLQYLEGAYLFVHGGVDPAKPLEQQAPEDLLWHRHEDQTRDDVFERIVVHGHTPVMEPFLGQYRINLDTGAYASNRLSCLVLEGDRRRLLALSDGR